MTLRFALLVAAAATAAFGTGVAHAAIPADVEVVLAVVLHHHEGRMAELGRRFNEVSTPGHPNHGKFLSQAEALALLNPGVDRVAAIRGWLTGVVGGGEAALRHLRPSPASDVLKLNMTVADAEALGLECSVRRHVPYRIKNGPSSPDPPPPGTTRIGCTLRPMALADASMDAHILHAEAAGAVQTSRLRRSSPPLKRKLRRRQATDVPLGCGRPPPPSTSGCPAPPPNPSAYPAIEFPPGAATDLMYGGPLFPSASAVPVNPNPNPTILIAPRCFHATGPRVLVPVSAADAEAHPELWTNKTENPCNDGHAVTAFTVTVTAASTGATFTATQPATSPNITCSHFNHSVCTLDGTLANGTLGARIYPYAVCEMVFADTDHKLHMGEGYTVEVTLELGGGVRNVTEQVSTFVAGATSAAPGSEQPAPLYVTQEKLADDMRAWYRVPAGVVVSGAARPQAYGILQPPTVGAGTYYPDDLSTAYRLNGLPQGLAEQAHFMTVPEIAAGEMANLVTNISVVNNDVLRSTDDTLATMPCSVPNDWVTCECGEVGLTIHTGIETSLDVQMTAGATQGGHTYGIHSGYWSSTGYNGAVSLRYGLPLDWGLQIMDIALAILLGTVVPWTLSFSYGHPMNCAEYITSLGSDSEFADYAALFVGETLLVLLSDVYFQALGAIGVSVFASAGDQGSHGSGCFLPPTTTAMLNAGCSVGDTPSYITLYPAGSAYVTAVGGTTLAPPTTSPPGQQGSGPACRTFGNLSESGCVTEQVISIASHGGITSGGGFVTGSAQPAWQTAAITEYLAKVNLQDTAGFAAPAGNVSALGVGYPDLTAFAGNILLVWGGLIIPAGGTSAASPFTAGLVSLLNSELQKRGVGPVGFLNPLLYAAPLSVFNDVVTGNNNCRGQTQSATICCETGYQAAAGWDPASGLGSLNFSALLAHVLTLPAFTPRPMSSPLPPWVPLATSPTAPGTVAVLACPLVSVADGSIDTSSCPNATVGVGGGRHGINPASHHHRSGTEKLSVGDDVGIGIGVFVFILLGCIVGAFARGSGRSKGKRSVDDDYEHELMVVD